MAAIPRTGVPEWRTMPVPRRNSDPKNRWSGNTLSRPCRCLFVWDERIFLTGIQNARPLSSLSVSGRLLWQRAVPADKLAIRSPVRWTGFGDANLTDGLRHGWFPMFGHGDGNFDGNELGASRSMPSLLSTGAAPRLFHGAGSSYAATSRAESFLLAADRATGKTLWQTARPQAVSNYTTPVVLASGRGHRSRDRGQPPCWAATGSKMAVSVCPAPRSSAADTSM